MAEKPLEEFFQFADRLLDAAAAISLRYFNDHGAVDTKADGSIVTIADQEIEQRLRSEIEAMYPEHGIIGEEQVNKETSTPYSWVIDPIDGTKAFAAGYPTFCSLIGLLYEGHPILGAVDQPVLKKRWDSNIVSVRNEPVGEPAMSVRSAASCESQQTFPEATRKIATTSIDYMSEAQLAALRTLKHQENLQIIYGGDAYAYMMLLEGKLDAVFDVELKPYDILPILPILAQDSAINVSFFEDGKHTNRITGDIVVSRSAKNLKKLSAVITST